jgi:hypothetical protein
MSDDASKGRSLRVFSCSWAMTRPATPLGSNWPKYQSTPFLLDSLEVEEIGLLPLRRVDLRM